jgi:murein DD-endopeptidase MepM/ murein hydrolase activator NlpD
MRSAVVFPKCSLLIALCLLFGAGAFSEPLYHVLAKGDTLYSVARKYKVSYDALAAANSISDPTKLRPGQKLLIPAVHVVAKGETLYGIARDYDTSVAEICSTNHIAKNATLKPGQSLILPASAASRADSSPANAAASHPTEGDKGNKPDPAATASSTGNSREAKSGPALPVPEPLKTSDRAVDQGLSWPCSGEARYLDGKLFGVMIRAPSGEETRSVASGRVVSAGPYRGFGQVVFVQAKSGHIYVYGGNESLKVKVGDTVRAGDDLGKVGVDPKEGRAIAYFFVFRGGEALDPAKAPRG